MTDPKRWIDDGVPDDVRELLVAASQEQPRRGSTERALTALGASGALAAARSAGAAPVVKGAGAAFAGKAAIGSAPAVLAIKWGLLGVVAALATAGTATVVWKNARPAPVQETARAPVVSAPTSHTIPAARSVEALAVPTQEPAPSLDREAIASAPAPRAPSARGASVELAPRSVPVDPAPHAAEPGAAESSHELAAARETAPALAGEVAMIDAARAELQRGDPANVIATLDGYASRFPIRHFEPEALYLRMEALGRQGDGSGQRRVAERLLSQFPGAPQAARARAVVEAAR